VTTRLAALGVAALLLQAGCGPPSDQTADQEVLAVPQAPPPPPSQWFPLIGEYAQGADTLSVLEEGGRLYALFWKGGGQALIQDTDSTLRMAENDGVLRLGRDEGQVEWLTLGAREFSRLSLGAADGGTFKITPLRSPDELREEALAATPPEEEGEFLPSDLVELAVLDPTIRLDIRYATTNNFMGAVFYESPRAFLQRPAAEAVVRVSAWLRERGYGLLVHDGYRPWYVTKMFWDATPEALRTFVADPANGSRHNRGCAVDLTLYDLTTGEAVTMPSGYDEMSPRSFADYPGGTARQRWYRKLLRDAMDAQGFTVYEAEWWHFDFKDWQRYRIENVTFQEIGKG